MLNLILSVKFHKCKIFIAVLAVNAVFYIYSCNSGGYEIEDIEGDTKDTIRTAEIIEIKKEIETPQAEIKEENVLNGNALKKYIIQAGAFYSERNAYEFTIIVKTKTDYQFNYCLIDEMYKVRYGDFTSKKEALLILSKLRDMGYKDAFIVELIR